MIFSNKRSLSGHFSDPHVFSMIVGLIFPSKINAINPKSVFTKLRHLDIQLKLTLMTKTQNRCKTELKTGN